MLLNGHLETIIPSLLYKAPMVNYHRQRLELKDGDFIDLDWLLKNNHDRLLIITHGLEGNSERHYVRRTAKYFHDLGWDVLAWNCRSCSGEINRLSKFYHHGDTNDLNEVISDVLSAKYSKVVLFGYSMGGSLSIKYLGEGRTLDPRIKGAVTYSVPLNLKDSGDQLEKRVNRFYANRFLKKLIKKVRIKAKYYPGILDIDGIDQIKTFDDFHRKYTLPLYGFSSIDDFYEKATCDQFLPYLSVPVFVGNALNDPLLGTKCYPREEAKRNKLFYLQTPLKGGHVGFSYQNKEYSWMETHGAYFINEVLLIS